MKKFQQCGVNLRLCLRIYWVNKLLLCKHLFTLVNMPRQDIIDSNVAMVLYFHNVLERGIGFKN